MVAARRNLPGSNVAGVALALALLLAPCAAPAQQPSVAAAAPGSGEMVLALGPGDRIAVSVFGQPELTGEQTLDVQGNIRLAIGGVLAAANLTAAQLEARITEMLADGYIVRPRVSVRISELRPVYVLGDVRSAGAIGYRYGMTALTAVALAGGFGSAQPDPLASRGELLETEQRLASLQDQRIALRARIVRLTAQRDEASSLDFPADLETGAPATLKLLAGERAVFGSDREAMLRQLALLTQQVKDAEAEVASIAEQTRVARQQLAMISGYLGDLDRLVRSGLIERRRVIEMQQEQGRITATIAQLDTQSVRATQLLREAPLRMAEIHAAARQRAVVALQEANSRLVELDSGIAATRELVAVRLQRAGAASLARGAHPPQIRVTRAGPGGSATFEGLETTALLPGDVLRVTESTEGPFRQAAQDRMPIAQPGRP